MVDPFKTLTTQNLGWKRGRYWPTKMLIRRRKSEARASIKTRTTRTSFWPTTRRTRRRRRSTTSIFPPQRHHSISVFLRNLTTEKVWSVCRIEIRVLGQSRNRDRAKPGFRSRSAAGTWWSRWNWMTRFVYKHTYRWSQITLSNRRFHIFLRSRDSPIVKAKSGRRGSLIHWKVRSIRANSKLV